MKARKKTHKKSRKSKKIRSDREKHKWIFEYYQPIFFQLHKESHNLFQKRNIEEPRELRQALVIEKAEMLDGQDKISQFNALFAILNRLEEILREVVSKRSVFYWIHIYRRISPILAADIGTRTDAVTALEVRAFAEQSIFKYGRLDNNLDIALSSEVGLERILGGLLKEYLDKHLNNKQVIAYESSLASPAQWVLVDFSVNDLATIYFIEGLAYQYWYICSRMRSLGKGVKLVRTACGNLDEVRTPEQQQLIYSYDSRCIRSHLGVGFASNVGTFVRSDLNNSKGHIIFAALNVEQHTAKDIGLNDLSENFSPNYLPASFDADAYFKSHKYLSVYFENKLGFSLFDFCQIAKLCSRILISLSNHSFDSMETPSLMYYSKFQRGYTFNGGSIAKLKKDIMQLLETLSDKENNPISIPDDKVDKILDFLTLTDKKQPMISLWSFGPRFPVIPHGQHYFYDYSSWHTIFRSLFFGLKNYDPSSKKGPEFEYAFGQMAEEMSFDVVAQSKKVKCGAIEREIDVGVRIGKHLYVFECRASERPLDFIIGKPKTLEERNRDFEEKINQVNTLVEFLEVNRSGDNYDYSWASSIRGMVVSPYTEWIWSLERRYWSEDGRFPKILSVSEAIEFLEDATKGICGINGP